MNATLATLEHAAACMPERTALHTADRRVSNRMLLDGARAIAEVLRERSVTVLALAADNCPEWIAADFATQLAGVVLVPLPPFFNGAQLAHALEDSGADAVLADAHAAERLGGLPLEPATALKDGLTLLPVRAPGRRALPAGTAKISYTSGTTGAPKGVCLAQASLDCVARSIADVTAELAIDRHLCLLPLATLLESVAGVYAPLLAGAEIALPSLAELGFDGATALDVGRFIGSISRHDAGSLILLPQTLAVLVGALERGGSRPASLRFAAVGGGHVPRALLERAERLRLPVYEGYGLTECGSVVALNTPSARRVGSAGKALPHVRLGIGTDGEIEVVGASFLGYAGSERIRSAPVATGDLGAIDHDGYLFVKGRQKNVFITSFGRNVCPEWIEAELAGHPAIAQAAVFGEARPFNVAVVVPASAATTSDQVAEAVVAANSALPHYARVHKWILAERPFAPGNGQLTATGKNRRAAIAAAYRSRIDECYPEWMDA